MKALRRAASRLHPDGQPDPFDQSHGRLRAALASDDFPQPAAEVRVVQARPALGQVLREAGSSIRLELTVKVMIEFVEDFFAANLGQGHAPGLHPTTASPAPFFPCATAT
jgi:hypothetical protein